MTHYRKINRQPMTPWVEGIDMDNVSISQVDVDNGSPKTGDMIAHSEENPNDRWLISQAFFEENYEECS